MKTRCTWPDPNDPLMIAYHDTEWGVPVHDDATHFEYLLLDTFQAGLSWRTILHKRENFRAAFDNFDYRKIATYTEEKVTELLNNPGIVRNTLKVRGTITNAQIFLDIQQEFGSFDAYVWRFVGGKPIDNAYTSAKDIPTTSPEAEALSKDMKKRGMKFVGPTVVYAYMQGAGLVNDHEVGCFRYEEIKKLR